VHFAPLSSAGEGPVAAEGSLPLGDWRLGGQTSVGEGEELVRGDRNTLAVVRENVVQVIFSQCRGCKAADYQHENFDGSMTRKSMPLQGGLGAFLSFPPPPPPPTG